MHMIKIVKILEQVIDVDGRPVNLKVETIGYVGNRGVREIVQDPARAMEFSNRTSAMATVASLKNRKTHILYGPSYDAVLVNPYAAKRPINKGASNMTLTDDQRQIRMSIRNFLLTATASELAQEKQISLDNGDLFRVMCIQELIDES
jgi:hypothetical protein